jgi:hypothetical protein
VFLLEGRKKALDQQPTQPVSVKVAVTIIEKNNKIKTLT